MLFKKFEDVTPAIAFGTALIDVGGKSAQKTQFSVELAETKRKVVNRPYSVIRKKKYSNCIPYLQTFFDCH